MQKWFAHFSKWFANLTGHPIVFILAFSVIIIWAVTGPVFGFSDTWQLVINTSTTIITFLMVFLIQNTQNRDAAAIQLKLDELIRSLGGAHNQMMDVEDRTMDELDELRKEYFSEAKDASEGKPVDDKKLIEKQSNTKRRTQASAPKSKSSARKGTRPKRAS